MYAYGTGTSEISEIKSMEQCTMYSYNMHACTGVYRCTYVRRRLPRTLARVPVGVKPPSRCISSPGRTQPILASFERAARARLYRNYR